MLIRARWRQLAFSRTARIAILVLTVWTIWDVATIRGAVRREAAKEIPPFNNEKIFIASIHWTDEAVLRSHWAPAVAQLAGDIGTENVFVSIYESGSVDNTKAVLQLLATDLEQSRIRHKIVLDETTHRDEVERPKAATGWIQMPSSQSYRDNWTEWFTLERDKWVPRRIPYLARLRNLVLQPLYELQEAGEKFDKVLWLNDVVFSSNDVRRLLNTRSGDYAAACALDFKHPPLFYDTFALRDAEGYEPLMETWPYFRSSISREALKHGQPVPVASCWNGIVAFDAASFYDTSGPLAFRGIDDSLAVSHLEASECCLIHADNPISSTKGVWINPHVRVGYNGTAYHQVNPGNAGSWPSSFSIASGIWSNRVRRWLRFLAFQDHTVANRIASWKQQSPANQEPGPFCLIDEMQILLWNGWGHA